DTIQLKNDISIVNAHSVHSAQNAETKLSFLLDAFEHINPELYTNLYNNNKKLCENGERGYPRVLNASNPHLADNALRTLQTPIEANQLSIIPFDIQWIITTYHQFFP